LSRIIDDFLLDGVRTLIQKSLRLAIKGIGLDIRELVAMLTDIFSVNARFYESTTQPSNFLRKNGLFAMPPQVGLLVSLLLRDLLTDP
jgi:hypothetical protein